MIDKSDTEIAAIKTVFPDSEIRICLFHVLQAWQRWMRASSNNVPRKPAQSEQKIIFRISEKKFFLFVEKKFFLCAEDVQKFLLAAVKGMAMATTKKAYEDSERA
jgi:hypothetical protein